MLSSFSFLFYTGIAFQMIKTILNIAEHTSQNVATLNSTSVFSASSTSTIGFTCSNERSSTYSNGMRVPDIACV
jgi:hypothetical protein